MGVQPITKGRLLTGDISFIAIGIFVQVAFKVGMHLVKIGTGNSTIYGMA